MTGLLRDTIIPKSDQLNADQIFVEPITITVTDVTVTASKDQPVTINYVNDNGRPFKPCKTMRVVLIKAWGDEDNGKSWIGRSMTLFCDPEVKWSGQAVGGVRISHLSHIKKPIPMMLTQTRGKKVPYTINVLGNQQQRVQPIAPQPEQPNAKREYAVKLKAAVNYGSIAVDEVWAMVPVELRADMDSFYKEQFIKSQGFDPVEQEPIPAHVSEELPPPSIDDF